MSTGDTIIPAESTPHDLQALADILAVAYRNRVKGLVEDLHMSLDQSVKSEAEMQRADADRVSGLDLTDISWEQLNAALAQDEKVALAVWERMKADARFDLEEGGRAARLVSWWDHGGPMQRARFLAQWTAFHNEVQPRGGLERALVDTLALSYWEYQSWVGYADSLAMHSVTDLETRLRVFTKWDPPRLTEAETEAHAVEMADRFHRQFLRTVRALKDYRRTGPSVMVGSAGQVNVAQQQVNVSRADSVQG